MDYAQIQIQLEEFIRAGEIARAKIELEKLVPSQIPRAFLSNFADIARRVRFEVWGLRLLRPVVRAVVPVHPAVTAAELCTYAGLLVKAGAAREAQNILQQLDPETNVNVFTFLSQVHIAQWNYKEAAVILKKSIAQKKSSPYQICIAQVNLASCYIFLEKYDLAKKLLQKILDACLENNWDLLYGNALELSAQVAVIQRDWLLADDLLNQAQSRAGEHSHYLIFIEKWRVLSKLFQSKPGSKESEIALKAIQQLRDRAQTLRSWETLRDLDYHVALFLNHQNLLLNVYFGTPHKEYKNRIEAIFKSKKWIIPDFYFRKLSENPTERVFDLATGSEDPSEFCEPLKPGKLLHRFLNILAMDFYKPVGSGELFSNLYPDEYFNPDSSPERLAQAVKQLRSWFEINKIPLKLKVLDNRYWLEAEQPYAFKISKKSQSGKELLNSGFELQIDKLKKKWPYQSFSASKAAGHLGLSDSTTRSLLQKALSENLLFTSGSGRSTLYRFEK